MKQLHIVLRTCDRSNVHTDWRQRYHGIPKPQLIEGCLRSLISSINQTLLWSVKLTVLDDHSSTSTVDSIQNILQKLDCESEFESLSETGYNYSAHQQLTRCKNSTADLVYTLEDDYLHCASAIQEMVDSFELFCSRLNRTDVVLYPFDEPSEYNPPGRTDFVVHGSARHWRTGVFTTQVVMTSPSLVRQHWDLFETLALKYNGDYLKPRPEHFEESNTIWKIWQNNQAIRFNPIPSLALHMQFDQQQDPFINWQQWWDTYAK